MIQHHIELRVRYAETDQMGYVYYGNYATYFEMGRVELLRSIGTSYREIEEKGIFLPVRDFSIRYIKPARYDDLLEIKTTLAELPGASIQFSYETLRAGELLNTALTTLVFVDRNRQRPMKAPDWLLSLMAPHFA